MKYVATALAATLAFLGPATGRAAQPDAGLFTEVSQPVAAAQDQTAVRRRWVTIEFTAIRDPQSEARAQIALNLFPDTRLVAALDHLETTAGGYVWIGRVPEIDGSSVMLAVNGTAVAGSVVTPDAAYAIRYAGGDVHVVQQVNVATLPPESPPLEVDLPPAADAPPSVMVDDGSTIDLLVVYTPSARTQQGGTSAIEALIDLGVAETNQAYANSGAIQRIRLVRKEEIAYTESGSHQTDLERLRATSDGHMDTVHMLRDTYGADLVQLIANAPTTCGFAYVMTSVGNFFASSAFGLTHYACISPNYSFAHEMGHNMGLRHDTFDDPATTPFPYSHGYINQAAFAGGAAAEKRWRDILASNAQCANAGFNCQRLLYFSNPLNTYTGDPMGHASTADGVRSLNDTRVTVANFRASVPVPTLSIDDVTIAEGNSGTTNATFTVTKSDVSGTATVDYATADVTATAANDYVGTAGTLTIAAGSTSQTLAITINGDTTFEPYETFNVNLSNAAGATIADGLGVGTITNQDFSDHPLTAGLAIKAVHITELRSVINDVRAAKGLAPFSFTEGTLTAGVTVIKATHIVEMRTALAAAYSAANQMAPSYTDPALTAGIVARAVHISEIRAAVLNIQ